MENTIVAKFGGASLANAIQIQKVIDIVCRKNDASKLYIVVSAPGERFAGDAKVTDLLYALCRTEPQDAEFSLLFKTLSERFQNIVTDLGLRFDLKPHLDELRVVAAVKNTLPDFAASRGEFLMAKILSEAIGAEFIDAAEFIRFNTAGDFDMEATKRCSSRLINSARICVIPGFYGSVFGQESEIRTFQRGGSDITGAIVAMLANAKTYETWKDVSGVFAADPKIVPGARNIDALTYQELQELAYTGANVLHDEVISVLQHTDIRIHVRNTNRPDDCGTLVVPCGQRPERCSGSIIGIAGRKGFTIFSLQKTLMNKEVGFAWRMLGVFADLKINLEHIPGGINSLSVIVANEALTADASDIVRALEKTCGADKISVRTNVALVCIVGCALVQTPAVYAATFTALASENIFIRAISEGSDDTSIVVGVDNEDYERAIRAVYRAFET